MGWDFWAKSWHLSIILKFSTWYVSSLNNIILQHFVGIGTTIETTTTGRTRIYHDTLIIFADLQGCYRKIILLTRCLKKTVVVAALPEMGKNPISMKKTNPTKTPRILKKPKVHACQSTPCFQKILRLAQMPSFIGNFWSLPKQAPVFLCLPHYPKKHPCYIGGVFLNHPIEKYFCKSNWI